MSPTTRGIRLYAVTVWFVLGLLLAGALFVAWVVLWRPLPASDNDHYQSVLDQQLLNEVVAMAIRPVSGGALAGPLTVDGLHAALAAQPGCLSAFQAYADRFPEQKQPQVWQRLTQRLQRLREEVQTESTNPRNRLQQAYDLDVGQWAAHACLILGQPAAVTGERIEVWHLADNLRQLARMGTGLFSPGNALWCEHSVNRNLRSCQASRTALQFSTTVLAMANPWSGLKGCLMWRDAPEAGQYYLLGGRGGNSQLSGQLAGMCAASVGASGVQEVRRADSLDPLAADDPAWMLPPALEDLVAPLQPLRTPQALRVAARDDAGEASRYRNQFVINRRLMDVGLNVELTFRPAVQRVAQQVAECYTGHPAACLAVRQAGVYRGDAFYESAMARRVAVVVMDARSGELEALASAHSACFLRDQQGQPRTDNCPRSSYSPRWRAEDLLNQAWHAEAQPASTVKVPMAVTFLQQPGAMSSSRVELARELAQSDSPAFLRRMFCLSPRPQPPEICPIPAAMQANALTMGWDGNCRAGNTDSSMPCGMQDNLWGRRAPPPLDELNTGLVVPRLNLYGQFMLDEQRHLLQDFSFRLKPGARTSDEGWQQEHPASLRHLANEGLGQGNALVSPIGDAGMLANLVVAASDQPVQVLPHLVRRVFDVHGTTPAPLVGLQPETLPVTVSPALAREVLRMMTGNHQYGTGSKACQAVMADQKKPAAVCQAQTRVAGKTGTPSLAWRVGRPPKNLTAEQAISQHQLAAVRTRPGVIPWKWYVGAWQSQPAQIDVARFDKVIAVLVERNWRKNGVMPDDAEGNAAAEIAFRIYRQLGVFKPATTESTP